MLREASNATSNGRREIPSFGRFIVRVGDEGLKRSNLSRCKRYLSHQLISIFNEDSS